MGVDYRRAPPLPAPTESESMISPTEPAQSELSQVTDKESHYSLPDDGTPVTIKTRGHRANKSQTSLLIEYFEGGKSSTSGSRATDRKPSVRVRLTPSKTRGNNDHIQITETRSSRVTSLSKKALATANLNSELDLSELEDDHSMHSYASATEESTISRQPIEVDIDPGSGHTRRRRKVSSPLIPAADSKSSTYNAGNMSDISAIPTDSFLDGSGPSNSREDPYAYNSTPLAAAGDKANRKQRSEHHGSTTHKSSKPERRHKSKSRASNVIEKEVDHRSSPRRKSKGTTHKESVVSAADPSVLSQISQLTPSHRSYDSHSSSKISINNPKLLETVEDAIRRLILPELDAIKRERSQRETKPKDRESLSSLTSVSREDITAADKRISVDTKKSNRSRGREARNDLSPQSSIGQFSYIEDAQDDDATPRRSRDLLTDAALGAAVGAAALRSKSRGDEKRQRRRRRAETPKRELDEKFEDEEADHKVEPPMPLTSEINPSEMTRTSILSADTDRPQSASEQMMPIREVARGVASMESMDDSTTPTRSPVNTLQNLGAQHANVSHGDLRALPRKGPAQHPDYEGQGYDPAYSQQDVYDEDEYDEPGHLGEPGVYEDDSLYYDSQHVPAPLRYVPYQQERRGLSPIQSVSGYTEGESEVQGYRDSRVTASDLSSPSKSPYHDRELRSQGSVPSNMRSREFGDEGSSILSSGLGYRNTVYTENSDIGPVTSGQAVKYIEGNPEVVHQQFGPESAVASLVDPSMMSGSVGGGQDYRDSQVSYNESSRGISPIKQSMGPMEQATHSPSPSREHEGSTASHQFAEYELNEYGQKVPQSAHRHSPTTSESAITAAALSRAAAAELKKLNQESKPLNEENGEEESAPVGVFRNKSFKDRARNGYRPDTTPRHSVDRLYSEGQPKMEANGLPDFNNPEPEIGYGYDDDQLSIQRTPSAADEVFDHIRPDYMSQWQEPATPTQEAANGFDRSVTPTPVKNNATAGVIAASHSRQPSQEQDDEWQRTSGDRKRDTLVTNPYEGASPIANLPGIDGNMFGAAGYGADTYRGAFHTGSPGMGGADEGYISAAPNEARDIRGKAPANIDDPFYAPKDLRLSGMSQGMQTPLFDPATGTGIDRIQSKDIIALMEHLMVRDAQRSARDTEILVTLVRSAAEMRNSFDDIKKMLAETEDTIVNDVNANTEKSIKRHLGGPRPFPGSSARSVQGSSQAGTEDMRAKKRNILRRALQGLSAKGTSDLSRIEDMLIQLLTDVDVLKHQTAVPVGMMSTRAPSVDNFQPEIPYEQDRGYEPEGNAGTSTASHASQSGHLSIPQSRGPSMRAASERKFSDHRISTVQEDEGEYEQTPGTAQNRLSRDGMLSPPSERQRGGSVPLGTPPQTSHGLQLSASNENTPRTADSKRKSKSSSFFPKISRWSETTASSLGKAFRSSGSSRKQEAADDFPQQPPSRSGSDLADFDPYLQQDHYGDDKLHTGFSAPDLLPQGMDSRGTPGLSQQTTAPMTYATPEDPKYRAHRDSLNLQHPQPRPGQTERFRTALETSAADYDSPMSPRSADWARSDTSLHRFPQQNTNRYSDNSASNAREDYNWGGAASPSSQGPARPPKEPLDTHSTGAQTPPQNASASKLLQKQGSPLPYQSVESGYGTATATHVGSYHSGSPRFENKNLSGALGMPTRRPSGPRAMTPSRSEDGEKDDRRRKRDTFGTIASPSSALSQESETF
ncbi:hypothetical protein F5B22DRAFT_661272 [Xylaria bambusicola]|uniref:uncharacterized protein n=1 Tax=Xylaria bambusicola TaxID=326684 RepID=UPI002007654E|nr:uncharacterized protein F5B22DRAFT_661272 [Xylaria bambusicola]KAI0521883.1 hypothetical protein F5B22DRAFT_661272 [Xylaria bambusicola]